MTIEEVKEKTKDHKCDEIEDRGNNKLGFVFIQNPPWPGSTAPTKTVVIANVSESDITIE